MVLLGNFSMMEDWRKGPIFALFQLGIMPVPFRVPVAATCGVCNAGPCLGAQILGYTRKLWFDGKLANKALPSFISAGCHACSCISIYGVVYVLLLGSCGPKSDLESARTCGVDVGLVPA